jgi:hypothetical protein
MTEHVRPKYNKFVESVRRILLQREENDYYTVYSVNGGGVFDTRTHLNTFG